jgi:hypothetical protein
MMIANIAIALLVQIFCSATTHAEVKFDWATVGNPGNGPDHTGFGSVPYVYRISKHEVTNAQYAEFLNAVDPNGANAINLYDSRMSVVTDVNPFAPQVVGGIDFIAGAANGAKYHVKPGRHSIPVVYVSFVGAMRFVNWLQNGQSSGSTESGVYTIGNGVKMVSEPESI